MSDSPSEHRPPDEASGPHARAWRLIHEGESEEDLQSAVEILSEHLETHSTDAGALVLISEALLAGGRPEESLEAALAAIEHDETEDHEPPFRAALAHFDLAAFGDGSEEEGTIQIEPTLHFLECLLEIPPLQTRHHAEQALELFRLAIARAPTEIGPLFWSAICQLNLGDSESAIDALGSALELGGPGEVLADMLFIAGLAHEDLDEIDAAREAHLAALATVPEHPGAQIRLDWLDPEARDGFLEPLQVRGLIAHLTAKLGIILESELRENPEFRQQVGEILPPYPLELLAAVCTGTLAHSREWGEANSFDVSRLESFLVYHGATADCEVLYNLELRLGLAPENGGEGCPDGPD